LLIVVQMLLVYACVLILLVESLYFQASIYSELSLSGTPNYLADVPLRLKSPLTISGTIPAYGPKRDKSRLKYGILDASWGAVETMISLNQKYFWAPRPSVYVIVYSKQ